MGEQQNILSGLVQTGTVTAIDSAKRKARVKFKDTGIIRAGSMYSSITERIFTLSRTRSTHMRSRTPSRAAARPANTLRTIICPART